MIDLSEITDKVARAYWEKLPGRPSYDTLSPHEKVGLKQSLLPIINQTATLVEADLREHIAAQIDAERFGRSHPDLIAWQPGLVQAAKIVRTGKGYRA